MTFTWQRYGGYEVSTQGDARFSAFHAVMPDGRSLECHFQCDTKSYSPGGTNWRLGKGKPPLNGMSRKELWEAYLNLWRIWAQRHGRLLEELHGLALAKGGVLSDRFASSDINQARALATLLNEQLSTTPEDFF